MYLYPSYCWWSLPWLAHILLCPTLCLRKTPTSHADRTVIIPTMHINLTIAQSSPRATKYPLQQLDHKKDGLQKIGPRHSQVHQGPLLQLGSYVGNTMSALQFHQLPLKLSAVSHQLRGISKDWPSFRDNLYLLFYSSFVQISTNLLSTIPSCTILFPKPGSYHKHGG